VNHYLRISGCLLLLLALLTEASMVPVWYSVKVSAEEGRYNDNDPNLYKDAELASRSLYLSHGQSGLYSLSLGLNDVEVVQENWEFRAFRRLARAELRLAKELTANAAGFYNSDNDQNTNWGLHLGFDVYHSLRNKIGINLGRHYSMTRNEVSTVYEIQQGFLNYLELRSTTGLLKLNLDLNLLATQESGWSGLAMLGRLGGGSLTGFSWKLSALSGKVKNWYDENLLVLHDNPQTLGRLVDASLLWRAVNGFEISMAVGWEKLQQHENRWLALVLGYNHVHWKLEDRQAYE
jgi:hypothetical protein